VIVSETGEDEVTPPVAGFTVFDERVYGDTRVTFLCR
jgi:hypothetical protein